MAAARPGDVASTTRRLTRDRIRTFATLTGDENPLHTDDEYAAETMFDGPIAHGMLSAGVVSSALADLPGDIVYVSQDLEFRRPVYPGQAVTARAEVAESLGGDRLLVHTAAEVDGSVVLDGEAVVLSIDRE